jgi:sugar phosphate isomerase/epimerase
MSYFDGYQVPLINPKDMLAFSKENSIFVNIDTTHYADSGIDIVQAADILKDCVKSVHLSDFKYGKTHLYIGEGDLNFKDFFNNLYLDKLYSITLECSIPYDYNNPNIAVKSMRRARNYLEYIIR